MRTIKFRQCFPCSPSSAIKNVAEDPVQVGFLTIPINDTELDVLSVIQVKDPTNKDASDVDIGPPTGSEYAGQAAIGFFQAIEAISEAVPIPAFGAAVKIAASIIKACDDAQASLERAEDLKVRIKTLVAVFVNELKGKKKKEEIHDKLIQDIENLNKDMEYVKETLDKITSQHRLLLICFQALNDSRVSKCVAIVNNSLESFNLASTINHTTMLTRLEQQIMKFYTAQQESLKILQVTMDDVKMILDERLPVGMSLSPSRAPIPTNSAIFHGRDALVMELVNIITGPLHRHICLFGLGGMGKTSTSLAVMSHPDIKNKYESHLCIWVPCVKATSASLFLDTLKLSLAISKDTGDTRGVIIKALQISPPIILLFDNFETPWDADGARSDVEQILRDIHAIGHVTLFITTRSFPPPCDDIPWYSKDIHGVDQKSAEEIYLAHHPEGINDPDLSHLLELVSYMPLAITLLAKVAKLIHLSAAELIKEYNVSGTSMLDQGLDAKSSMDISIGLSVYSEPMKANPEAFKLLCILSMLPTGTSLSMLSRWWAHELSLVRALSVLKNASLVEERGLTYFVLPVIQHYILDSSRLSPEVYTSMIKTACAFLKKHEADFSNPLYKEHVAALSQEEGNLETILLQVTTSDPYIIRNGLLSLAHYQRDNRPRIDIIEHALKLVHDLDDKLLQGDILSCYGDISMNLSFIPIDKCLQHFKGALELFLSVSDKKRAAETYLNINHALALHPDVTIESRKQAIREAKIIFESINNEGGIACCELALGELGWQYSTMEEAFAATLNSLKTAEEIFARIRNLSLHAVTTGYLASFYYKRCQYDLANSWAASSLEECKNIGYSIGHLSALRTLGQIASAQGDYEGSLQNFIESIKVGKSLGLPPSGDALEGIGIAWAKLGKVIDACKAFEEALHQHYSEEPTRNSKHDIMRIQFLLNHLEHPQLSPSIDELRALQKWYSQDHLEGILAVM
ncbi:hypothetical protein C0992_012021 [Termitomyces sp. T32_za158]|nr:hypothetical protein C0992_012021 [Termitomyces sp. T32_za158]